MKRVLAVIALVAAAQAANAQDTLSISGMAPTLGGDIVKRQVTIRTGDVDPADAAGAAKIYSRITLAANVVCAGNIGGTSNLLTDKVAKCKTAAIAQAVKEVGTPAIETAAANAK